MRQISLSDNFLPSFFLQPAITQNFPVSYPPTYRGERIPPPTPTASKRKRWVLSRS